MFYTFIGIVALALVVGGVLWFLKNRKDKKEEGMSTAPTIVQGVDGSRKPMKKALLVGINTYKSDLNADLKGCVNDVENIRDILVNIYKFNPENIRVIIDDRATKQQIMDRLVWLVNGRIPGDELVFHYSGHGSQVRDRNGDELDDGLDEILCPHDLNWDDPLLDDWLGDLFSQLKPGVHLTMICDSCHSGSMTRTLCENPHYVAPRFLMPPYDIRSRSLGLDLHKTTIRESINNQNHVLMSGCEDHQTSADAFINGKYQGAMTASLCAAIRANPNATWPEIHDSVCAMLKGKFTQNPQLSGNDDLMTRPIFGGV